MAKKYHQTRKNLKKISPCGIGGLRFGDEDPEFGAEPADEAAGHEVDNAAIAAINQCVTGHFRFEAKVVVGKIAADDDHLLASNGLGDGSNEVDAAFEIGGRQAACPHRHRIAGMDVGQLFFRDLHFHRDVSDIGDAAQLVARIQVLIQLAFDERGGDDAVDRSDDIRLVEFLVEDFDLLLAAWRRRPPPGGSARAGFPPSRASARSGLPPARAS